MDRRSIIAFRDLFRWLDQTHRRLVPDHLTGELSTVYEYLIRDYRPASDQDVERLLPQNEGDRKDFTDAGVYLYLSPTPIPSITLPFLPFIQCNLGERANAAQFYVGMGMLDNSGARRVLGLRYEAPEGGGDGAHDCYHAQIITSFRSSARELNPQSSDFSLLPTRQPSIPLDANDPVTLALALLVSLYGMEYLEEVVVSGNGIKTYIENMRCWAHRFSHWRAMSDGTEYFVRSRKLELERLKPILSTRLGARRLKIEPSTLRLFSAAVDKRRIDLTAPSSAAVLDGGSRKKK